MRLIDADEFIANLKDYINKPMTAGLCATLIELAPTAYDVNKVVEELESDERHTFDGCINKRYAIEIVKKGGLNDN